MRAYAVFRFKEHPQLRDIPMPFAENATLVRINYAGMNPIDYKLADMLTETSHFPFVLGIDFAGVVETPAPGSTWKTGDKVFGMARSCGAYAEATAVPEQSPTEGIALIPEGVAEEHAAALPVAGMAALSAIELLKAGSGKNVVIVGAAGAVGGYATQMARARGANIFAVVRPRSREDAFQLGATEVYEGELPEALEELHRAHPEGVDAVLDLVSSRQSLGAHLRILKPGGALASSLRAADEQWFAQHQISAFNLSSATNPIPLAEGLKALGHLLQKGVITPRIRSIVPIEEASDAVKLLREGGSEGNSFFAWSLRQAFAFSSPNKSAWRK